MLVQIDTKNKTIKFQESVNVQKIIDMIQKLPEDIFGNYREYNLVPELKVEYNHWNYPFWGQPVVYPYITYTTNSGTFNTLTSGTTNSDGIVNLSLL